jgi:adenine deaminase
MSKKNMILGNEKADLVYKDVNFFNVFSKEWQTSDIAISDGMIIGIGTYEGLTERKINGFVVPGLIDTHVHIESSFMLPQSFSNITLKNGVTTVIADPHEIGNVAGVEGIKMMINDAKKAQASIKFMIPSCVPATKFESSGAIIKNDDILPFYKEKSVLGLAEVMDFPAVVNGDEEIINKINSALELKKIVDGHAPGLIGKPLQAYIYSGIMTDHESSSKSEAIEKINNGMQLLIREGTAAKNLSELIGLVSDKNVSSFCFCTDDRHIDDLINVGSINYMVKKSVELGCSVENAITIATINAARTYNLNDRGAIAPGKRADFAVFDSLDALNVVETYIKGEKFSPQKIKTEKFNEKNTINSIENISLKYPINETTKFAIEIISNQIITKKAKIDLHHVNNFETKIDSDYVKLCVVERHNAKNEIGIGLVKNFDLENGAIASTVAHDSHNIICIGTNDADMLVAIDELKKNRGGYAVVKNNQVVATLSLEIGGIMSQRSAQDLLRDNQKLIQSLAEVGFKGDYNPFLTLSFIALPVIPSLKLTSKGMYDVDQQEFVNM